MRAVHIPLGLSKRSRAGAMAINVRVTLAFDNWRRRWSSVVTPAPACLISAAASEESAAVAADSRIVRRRLCIAPAEMAHSETARFRSSYGGANSRRLAFCGGCAMFIRFPAAARSRGRSLPPGGEVPAAVPGPADGYPDLLPASPAHRHPRGLSPAEGRHRQPPSGRPFRKEVTLCRTSTQGRSGRTS
jgi:hypothetical protein